MEELNELATILPLEDVVGNSDILDTLLCISNQLDFLINLVFVFLVIFSLINVVKYLYVLLNGFTKL